jgi:uncharacterized protein YggE
MAIRDHVNAIVRRRTLTRSRPSATAAGPTIAGLVLGLSSLPVTALAQDQAESVVTVSGRGSVEAEADRARVFLAVETEAESAQDAAAANADAMTAVTAAVRAAGEDAEGFRLTTSGYGLNPRYASEAGDSRTRIVGYTARNTLEVTVDEVDRVGALIDAGLGAGANRVAGLNFEIRDPEPLRTEALREAVRLARAEAETMADALGMTLGPPLDVQGGAEDRYPVVRTYQESNAMQLRAAPAPTPIESGPLTVSANVTIRFRLDPLP